ncbi:MAG TPA: DUF1345 domain-containing protein [Aquabacterium sp.]|uniref:DUF1345 domain-containing protein n=1 Tax=Aquabacterium sp. TaxID=1872578 RepID=UPI002E340534|nr:DUF1345 domain-containing protein [Aquabacterium sp.]HEX5357535.1 DUF1345 domain-containing protein [Aquabacterium sp.]
MLHKIPLLRQIQIRPRLFVSGAIGVAVVLLMPDQWAAREVTRWIVGWNVGAWIYLALAGWMMAHASHAQIQRRACQEDDGALAILTLVVLAALASLGSIVAELSVAKEFTGMARTLHIALAGVTILSSWAFTQMMFALHYAHDFYIARRHGRPGGLLFPDTPDPDYLDFLYFAAVIGTSGQTADVSMASSGMRRVGLVHCVLAFLFNTSLVALTINVASSLL